MEMIKIENKLQILKETPSDINEHLEVIKTYAQECNHVTEMGVRWCVSTWALLASNPKKMISYDIVKHNNIDEAIQLAYEYNIDFNFITADVLTINIENTDLLFIDTLHSYNQLYSELCKHSNMVNKYIVLHDTETFGYKNENIYDHASDVVKNISINNKFGLKQAIEDFLITNEGISWDIDKIYINNNGLTILKRIK